MPDFSSLIAELRRRNVFKAGGAYLAASWVIVQLMSVALPAFGAPDWVLRVLIFILALGLPLMLAFAWAFELTPEGLKRTEEVDPARSQTKETGRKIQYLIIGLLGLAVVVLAVDRFITTEPRAGASGEAAPAQIAGIPNAPRDDALAVMPFRTSGPETDVWREGMMDMLTTNLDGMGRLQGISTRTVLARLRETGQQNPDLPTTLNAARAAGAAMALVGEVISTGETVRITAAMHDTETGDIHGRLQVEGDADDFLDLVDRLTVQVVEAARSGESGGDALPVPELSALTTESLPALRAYLAGENLFRQSRFREAMAQFEQAVQRDSTFAMAHLRQAIAIVGARDASPEMIAGVQTSLRAAQRHGNRLPPRETALLEGSFEYAVEGDVTQTVDRARAGVEAHPTDPELWDMYGSMLHGHPNVRPGAQQDGLAALRRAVRLDSSLTSPQRRLVSFAISTGDTAEARRGIAAFARHDGAASASGVTASLRAAHDLAYGDSAAQARVLQQVRDDAFPRRGVFIKLALRRSPTADALEAQRRFGQVVREEEGIYSMQTLAWIFSGQYEALRAFVRDTTQASRLARLHRQQAASVLHGRGALAPSGVPTGLTTGTCATDMSLRHRLRGCYYQARIAAHRQRAGLLPQEEADVITQAARSVLAQTIRELEAAGDGLFGTLAQGYLDFLNEMAALDAGDAGAAGRIQTAYQPLVLIGSLGEWEPMAASVRTQLRAGRAGEALPYAEMIATQDPYGHYLAGRAHEAAGNPEVARTAYEQFVSAWRDADPDIPALRYARAVLDGAASAEAPPL